MEAAMIIQSAWRAKLEERHAKGLDKDDVEKAHAYEAMQKRLHKTEEEMYEKEKKRLAGEVDVIAEGNKDKALRDAINEQLMDEEEDRRMYGSAWNQGTQSEKAKASKIINK